MNFDKKVTNNFVSENNDIPPYTALGKTTRTFQPVTKRKAHRKDQCVEQS